MNQHYWSEVIKRLGFNEQGAWLVYLAGAILLSLAILLRKRISWKEWYVTFGVVGFLAWMADIVLFFQLDLLDSGKPAIGSFPDLIMFSIAPSCIAVLYLNYYTNNKRWIIGLIFTLCSLIIEYLLVKVGFLTQKGWRTWYSIPFYSFMYFIFLPWHLRFIRVEKQIDTEKITPKRNHIIFFLNFLSKKKRAR